MGQHVSYVDAGNGRLANEPIKERGGSRPRGAETLELNETGELETTAA